MGWTKADERKLDEAHRQFREWPKDDPEGRLKLYAGKMARLRSRRADAAPECPGCGAGVDRPKCLFEMGSSCPRHEVRDKWVASLRRP